MGQASNSTPSASDGLPPADWRIGWADFVRQSGEAGQAQAQDPEAVLRHHYQLVHSCNDAIIAVALDGVIISWNPAAEAAFGTPAERAVGASIFTILPHLAIDHLPNLIGEALQRRRAHAVESTRGCSAHNRRSTVSIMPSPILENGEVIGVSLIARDCPGRNDADEPPSLRRDQARGDAFRAPTSVQSGQ